MVKVPLTTVSTPSMHTPRTPGAMALKVYVGLRPWAAARAISWPEVVAGAWTGAGAGAGGKVVAAVTAGVVAEDLVCALVWGFGFVVFGSGSPSDSDSDSELECVPKVASESDSGIGLVPGIFGLYIPQTGHSPF